MKHHGLNQHLSRILDVLHESHSCCVNVFFLPTVFDKIKITGTAAISINTTNTITIIISALIFGFIFLNTITKYNKKYYFIIKMSIHVVTVANKSDGYYKILKQSCILHGCKLTTLGFGEKWGGFVWKYTQMQKFLKTVDPTDIVIFVDGFDVIMTEHIDTFMTKYNEFGKSIVIGISNLNELTKFISRRVFKVVKYNGKRYYTCSGLYVGFVSDLSTMFDLIDRYLGFSNYNDDQVLLNKFLNSSNPIIKEFVKSKIALDTQVTLFNNTARKSTLDSIFKYTGQINLKYALTESGPKLLNQYNKSSSFIHGPGSINLKPYIEKLGYTDVPDTVPYVNARLTHYTKLFINGMFWYDWVLVFIVLIILIVIGIILVKKIQMKKIRMKQNRMKQIE